LKLHNRKEEGRRKKSEGRGKREEGRRQKAEGRGKKEEEQLSTVNSLLCWQLLFFLNKPAAFLLTNSPVP
jgi:hypothetical protein